MFKHLMAQVSSGESQLMIAFFIVLGLMVLGSLYFWVRAIKRWQQGEQLLVDTPQPSPLGFVDLVLVFAVWVAGQAVSGILAAFFLDISELTAKPWTAETTTTVMLLGAASQLGGTLLAAGLLWFRYRSGLAMGLPDAKWTMRFRQGFWAFLMIVPVVLGIQWLLAFLVPYEHPTLSALEENPQISTILICWFAAVLVAPLTEEFFFRGVLQNWLQRINVTSLASTRLTMGGFDDGAARNLLLAKSDPSTAIAAETVSDIVHDDSNPYQTPAGVGAGKPASLSKSLQVPFWPVLVSAAIFAVLHLGQGAAPIPLFVLGIGLGYLYRQTSSIVPCVIVHLLLNGYSMFWFSLGAVFS